MQLNIAFQFHPTPVRMRVNRELMTTDISDTGGKRSPYTLLVGRHTGVITVEITMQVQYTRTHKYKYWTCISSFRDLRPLPTGTFPQALDHPS